MRPVAAEFETSQEFGGGATAGVVGNIGASHDTIEYYVGLYGNYQEFGHAGKDIACPIGTPIHAIADGTVLYAGWVEDLPGTGNVRAWDLYYNFGGIVTVIQHDGWISVTAHQSNNDAVSVGQRVTEGQLIGLSGNTKTRTTTVAAHVHIEALVYLDYRTNVRAGIIYGRVDPTPFFGGLAAQGTITQEDDMADSVDRIYEFTTTLFRQYHEASIAKIYQFTTTLFKQYHEASINETRAALRDSFKAYAEANGSGQADPAAFAVAVAQHFDAIIDAGVAAVAVPATVTVEPLDIPAVAK